MWTDSEIVLSWYNSQKLMVPFVARRIKEIKDNSNLQMRYVPTKLNPADGATRVQDSVAYDKYWLFGPSFLVKLENSWPTNLNDKSITYSFAVEEDLPIEKVDYLSQKVNVILFIYFILCFMLC